MVPILTFWRKLIAANSDKILTISHLLRTMHFSNFNHYLK